MTAPIVCRGVNISDHVATMFDALVSSAGWGSGFLDTETLESILTVAELAGFDVPELDSNPPGFVPLCPPGFPSGAQMPDGGWPADRPEVFTEAQRLLAEHRQASNAIWQENQAAKAAAIAAWRAQVQAKVRAMATEDDQ